MELLHVLYREFICQEDARVQETMLTVPNLITALGIIAILIYVLQFLTASFVYVIPLTVGIAVASDLLDGFAARRLNQHTFSGKLFDALRDRLLRIAVFANAIVAASAGKTLEELWPLLIPFAIVLTIEWTTFRTHIGEYHKRKFAKGHKVTRALQIPAMILMGLIVVQEYWLPPLMPRALLLWIIAIIGLVQARYFRYAQKNS